MSNRKTDDSNSRNPINNNNNNNRGRSSLQLQHFAERSVQAASAVPARFRRLYQRRLVITWHALARLVGAYEGEREEEEMGATEVERINALLQAVHRFLQLLEGAYVDFIAFSVCPTLHRGDVDMDESNRAFFSLDRATLDDHDIDFDQANNETAAEAHHPQMMLVKRQLVELVRVLFNNLRGEGQRRRQGQGGRGKGRRRRRRRGGSRPNQGQEGDQVRVLQTEETILTAGTEFLRSLQSFPAALHSSIEAGTIGGRTPFDGATLSAD